MQRRPHSRQRICRTTWQRRCRRQHWNAENQRCLVAQRSARWCARRKAQYRCLHVTITCEGLVLEAPVRGSSRFDCGMSRSRSSKLLFVRVYMRTRLRYRTQIGWVPLVSAVHIRRASACCQRGGFASFFFASLSFSVRCQQGVSKSSVHDVRPPSTATSPMPVRAACAADQVRVIAKLYRLSC